MGGRHGYLVTPTTPCPLHSVTLQHSTLSTPYVTHHHTSFNLSCSLRGWHHLWTIPRHWTLPPVLPLAKSLWAYDMFGYVIETSHHSQNRNYTWHIHISTISNKYRKFHAISEIRKQTDRHTVIYKSRQSHLLQYFMSRHRFLMT